MNFGYLIFSKSNSEIDYPLLAYALALSIKNTQKEGYDRVALVIDDKKQIDKFKSSWVFDEVIEWDGPEGWDGRSYMDKMTPWDYTVCLDADMLFLRDYSHWIEYFISNCELYIANKSYTYRGELVTNDSYRKTFTANKLPNLYSFFTFFKKGTQTVNNFFNLNRKIINNPTEFSNSFLTNYKPKVIGTDEAFALSSKILDITDQIAYSLEFPRVVHMKPLVQNWALPANKVTDRVGFYLNKQNKLKIGNFEQTDIVHYVEKDLITDELISILEHKLWKK